MPAKPKADAAEKEERRTPPRTRPRVVHSDDKKERYLCKGKHNNKLWVRCHELMIDSDLVLSLPIFAYSLTVARLVFDSIYSK
jgi:hypothetical protein